MAGLVDYSPISEALQFNQNYKIKLQELELQKQAEQRRAEYQDLLKLEMEQNIKDKQSANAWAKAVGNIPMTENVTSKEITGIRPQSENTDDYYTGMGGAIDPSEATPIIQDVTRTVPRSPSAIMQDVIKAAGAGQGNAAAATVALKDYLGSVKADNELKIQFERRKSQLFRTLQPILRRGGIEENTRAAMIEGNPEHAHWLEKLPTYSRTENPRVAELHSSTETDDKGNPKLIGYSVMMPDGSYRIMPSTTDKAMLDKLTQAKTELTGAQTGLTKAKTVTETKKAEGTLPSGRGGGGGNEGAEISRQRQLYNDEIKAATQKLTEISNANKTDLMLGRGGLDKRIEAAKKVGKHEEAKRIQNIADKYDAALVERDAAVIKLKRLSSKQESRTGGGAKSSKYKEGQTATGKNGEKYIFTDGEWRLK